jgi:hypothetical protein
MSAATETPADWQEIVQTRTEHLRLSEEAYDRYVRNHARASAARSARERLKRDLPDAERHECERVASELYDARREADHGLGAHKEHLRRATEIVEEHPEAFIAWAQSEDEKVKAAAEALVPYLKAYLAAWSDAKTRWDEIRRGTRVHLHASSIGHYPGDAIAEAAELIDCPISATAAEEVLTVMPRPRGM